MPAIRDIPGPYRFFSTASTAASRCTFMYSATAPRADSGLEPLALAANRRFSARELNQIRGIIAAHHGVVRDASTKHCGGA